MENEKNVKLSRRAAFSLSNLRPIEKDRIRRSFDRLHPSDLKPLDAFSTNGSHHKLYSVHVGNDLGMIYDLNDNTVMDIVRYEKVRQVVDMLQGL